MVHRAGQQLRKRSEVDLNFRYPFPGYASTPSSAGRPPPPPRFA